MEPESEEDVGEFSLLFPYMYKLVAFLEDVLEVEVAKIFSFLVCEAAFVEEAFVEDDGNTSSFNSAKSPSFSKSLMIFLTAPEYFPKLLPKLRSPLKTFPIRSVMVLGLLTAVLTRAVILREPLNLIAPVSYISYTNAPVIY